MIYLNRDSNEITAQEWAVLIRNLHYPTVVEERVGNQCFRVAWLGLKISGARSPANFVVDACSVQRIPSYRGGKDYDHRSPRRPIHYFDTEREALDYLEKLLHTMEAGHGEADGHRLDGPHL